MNEKNDQLIDQVNQLVKKVSELEHEIQEARVFFNETEKTGKIGGWQFDPANSETNLDRRSISNS